MYIKILHARTIVSGSRRG